MFALRLADRNDWPDIEQWVPVKGAPDSLRHLTLQAVVAETDGMLAGVGVFELQGNAAVVHGIRVDDAERRQGIGSALLERAASEAAGRGAQWMFARAQGCDRFLQQAGFEEERLDLVPEAAQAALQGAGGSLMSRASRASRVGGPAREQQPT